MVERSEEREKLILELLPSIRHIASRFSAILPACVDIGDLVSEGVFGLLSAADRFDPARGVKFKTYAESRIRGAMLDSLRSQDWLPRSLRRKLKRLFRACSELEKHFGRPPSEKEVAEEMGIELDDLRELMVLSSTNSRHQRERQFREVPHDLGVETSLVDFRQNAMIRVQQREMRGILTEAIGRLSARERLVVSLYYYDGLTMKEIGKVLGVKESRISQYHSRAKAKLYGRLRKVLVSADPRVWSTLD